MTIRHPVLSTMSLAASLVLSAAATATTAHAAEPAAATKARICLVLPRAQLGQGTSGEDVSEPVRQTMLSYLNGPTTDLVALLTSHGLTPAVAQRVAAESGGIPSLALALAGAIGEQPSVQGRPRPTPPRIERMLRERLSAQPNDVRTTLLHASLMLRPTTRLLVRAGLDDAEAHLRQATRAGPVQGYVGRSD